MSVRPQRTRFSLNGTLQNFIVGVLGQKKKHCPCRRKQACDISLNSS